MCVLLSIKVRHLVEDPKLSNGMRCLMSRNLPVLTPICSHWPSCLISISSGGLPLPDPIFPHSPLYRLTDYRFIALFPMSPAQSVKARRTLFLSFHWL